MDGQSVDICYQHVSERKAHFETTLEITQRQLGPFKGTIEGLIDISVSKSARKTYGVSIVFARAFTWNEIAPQVLLALADIAHVELSNFELRYGEHYPLGEKKDLSWILDAAKKLRPESPEDSSPYPFALTLDDVKPGVGFMRYNTRFGTLEELRFTGEPDKNGNRVSCAKADGRPYMFGFISISESGIRPHHYGWNQVTFTIANTIEGRRQFAKWLICKGDSISLRTATTLLKRHPSVFFALEVKESGGQFTVHAKATLECLKLLLRPDSTSIEQRERRLPDRQSVYITCHDSTGGKATLDTRHVLTSEQVTAFRDKIHGVIDARVHDKYGVKVYIGKTSTWREIAPQVLLVLADIMGVELEHLELYNGSVYRKDADVLWILSAARKLRPGSSPLYPFALTLDDVEPGVEFMSYSLTNGIRLEDVFKSVPDQEYGIFATTGSSSTIYLPDHGIMPYPHKWSSDRFTIANTIESRRQLAKWLIRKGDDISVQTAAALFERYPTEFLTLTMEVVG